MKTINNPTVYAFAVTALLAGLYTAPANAGGGRSGAIAPSLETQAKAVEQINRSQRDTQTQLDELRKEVSELKAQLAGDKGIVSK
jgi:hypothetical protein